MAPGYLVLYESGIRAMRTLTLDRLHLGGLVNHPMVGVTNMEHHVPHEQNAHSLHMLFAPASPLSSTLTTLLLPYHLISDDLVHALIQHPMQTLRKLTIDSRIDFHDQVPLVIPTCCRLSRSMCGRLNEAFPLVTHLELFGNVPNNLAAFDNVEYLVLAWFEKYSFNEVYDIIEDAEVIIHMEEYILRLPALHHLEMISFNIVMDYAVISSLTLLSILNFTALYTGGICAYNIGNCPTLQFLQCYSDEVVPSCPLLFRLHVQVTTGQDCVDNLCNFYMNRDPLPPILYISADPSSDEVDMRSIAISLPPAPLPPHVYVCIQHGRNNNMFSLVTIISRALRVIPPEVLATYQPEQMGMARFYTNFPLGAGVAEEYQRRLTPNTNVDDLPILPGYNLVYILIGAGVTGPSSHLEDTLWLPTAPSSIVRFQPAWYTHEKTLRDEDDDDAVLDDMRGMMME
eukprot:TRINITY_DN8733_c0_g1_i1.p1 TRINITY_DN8733_c0_g1~~TRINITY_DN8733_c0_g1_i1.p1  ORF type:complete len:457 (-),score=44.33 TRINITY_DN8733_c0_g1_i1:20-1390(-)